MQSRVNTGVREKYNAQNVKFILWLFDNREHYGALLAPALLQALPAQVKRDRARTTKADKSLKGRDHARATCREWLQKVDAEKPETHPLKLQDLSFQVLSRFRNTFKKKAKKRSSSGDEDETVSVRLSQSAFGGAT